MSTMATRTTTPAINAYLPVLARVLMSSLFIWDGVLQLGGFIRGPDHQSAKIHRTLLVGDINSRTVLLIIEIGNTLVGHHSNYFPGDLWPQFGFSRNDLLNQNALPYGILILEILSDHGFVDDGDGWSTGEIVVAEPASFL